jgi:type I restriction enzyme R subunit
VGIVTSFEPYPNAISREPPDSDERYKYDTYKQYVLPGFPNTEKYEAEIKRRFIEEPVNTKLLIVVDKLLTGFDAPSCTYIYLDNKLHDHNLFQAICRTNRLDGDDKDYGYIVDYQELFADVQQAIAVYSSDELDDEPGNGGGNNVYLKNWLEEGRKKLDEAREALHYLCEPVLLPHELEQFIRYFCGDAAPPESLTQTEPLRIAFYMAVATYLRAFAAIAPNLTEAGYTDDEADILRQESEFYAEVRSAIKHHSGEELDIKPYESDMRHLINTYIQAEPAQALGELGELSLTDLIIKTGIHDAITRKLNEKGKLSRNVIAETVINNVRKTIIRDRLTDPRFYEQMSKLLDDLIQQSCKDTEAYEKFLRDAEALVRKLNEKQSDSDVPFILRGNAAALAIYRNLPDILAEDVPLADSDQGPRTDYGDTMAILALQIDRVMNEQAQAGWRGNQAKENMVQSFLYPLMGKNPETTLKLFELLKNQPSYP